MQSPKLRPVLKLPAIIHNTVRMVTANNAVFEANSKQNLKTWNDIPGPSSLPIIGQLRHFLPGGSLRGPMDKNLQDRLYQQYGSIVKLDGWLGAPATLFLYDAEAISQILRGENFIPKRPGLQSLEYYRKVYNGNIKESTNEPTGLLTDHDEVWKKLRTTVNPIMLKPQTVKLYTNTLDDVALDMVARLKSIRDEKNMLKSSFEVEMNLWALESIGVVALGGRLNCLDPNLPQDSPARILIQVVHDVFKVAEQLDFKPSLWRYITTPTFKKAMSIYEELQILSKGFITRAIEQFQSKNLQSDDEKGILEKLLEINETVAVTMANDMLFAGVETISHTMTATLYFLATNPEKQRKLREEILSEHERRPYLKACIKESMRMKPVTRGTLRKLSKNYNILGYDIPKHTFVLFLHQNLSTMDDQYPQPNEYMPERWIAEKDDPIYHGNAHPFAFSPFGFGVRTCIGRRIADLELETFLARMVENFEIEWFGPPMKTHAALLNYTAPPYNFIFKDFKNN